MRLNLALSFKKEGYDVVFVTPYDKYSCRLKEKFIHKDIYINSKGINPIEDLKTIYNLYQVYKELKPDIICH